MTLGIKQTDDPERQARRSEALKERSSEGTAMKRVTLIAGFASAAALTAAAWSAPAAATMCGSSACAVVHNRMPYRPVVNQQNNPSQTSPSGVPEPGVLPLLAFGLGGVGLLAFRRKRVKA
jgi:hypothetical protein